MSNLDSKISEQLEGLRLQLAITNHLSEMEVVLDPESLWVALELEGRYFDKQGWIRNRSYDINYQQQVSYFGIIDAVSNIVYGENLSNRDRFTRLLTEYVKWKDADRVSLPHVYQMLRMFPFPEFSNAREHVFEIIDKWIQGDKNPISITNDVLAGEVGTWFGNNVSAILKPTELSLHDLKHSALLYRHRSRLVHTMRAHGYQWSRLLSGHSLDEPCYVRSLRFIEIEEGQKELDNAVFQLIYPQEFVRKIATQAVESLRQYLKTWRMIHPIPNKFDVYFYPQLNPRD